ncbi:MAG TPA: methyltransferase domain-containing protein [Candidatus Udaeobacter sp.]|nr:methyltransferase domain-containing protein [Candidatus Udaeobacter sp.]
MEELLRIARESPLTDLIERNLPTTGRVLEAGCGLGQYVLLLRERGRVAVGADWSLEALRAGARAGAPVSVMDLRTLGIATGAVAAYLSLGVVEHDPEGPDAILREAARVVPAGGRLLLSVPYWNGARRLATPYLRRQARLTRAAGGQFYQYAFTRRELGQRLAAHGFVVRGFHPYDPARVLRKALRALRGGAPVSSSGVATSARPAPASATRDGRARRPAWRRAARALLYSGPALRLFGHMVLAVGVRR